MKNRAFPAKNITSLNLPLKTSWEYWLDLAKPKSAFRVTKMEYNNDENRSVKLSLWSTCGEITLWMGKI